MIHRSPKPSFSSKFGQLHVSISQQPKKTRGPRFQSHPRALYHPTHAVDRPRRAKEAPHLSYHLRFFSWNAATGSD